MLVPIVVLVCVVAAPGTFPIRVWLSGLYCSRTRASPSGHMVLWVLLQCPMLVPIVVLVCIVAAPGTFPIRAHGSMGSTPVSHACAYSCPACIVAAPGTFPIRAHGSMGSTPVSHACAYSCPGLYCSRTRNLPHQGTWFYEFYSSVSCLCL